MNTQHHIDLNVVDWLGLALATIGAINWGLVGLSGFVGENLNLVEMLFGSFPTVESAIYLAVGLAGLYLLFFGYQLYEASQNDEVDTTTEPRVQ